MTPTNFYRSCAVYLGRATTYSRGALHPDGTNEQVEALVDAITYNVHMNGGMRTVDNELKIDEAFIASCLSEAGFSRAHGQDLVGAMSAGDVKAALAKNTEEAVERGVYGSPTMFIQQDGAEEFMVFGSDRMEQIAFMTGNEYLGANPSRAKL